MLATGVTGLQFVTGVQWLNQMFNGVALIAAVSFAVWRQGRSTELVSVWIWRQMLREMRHTAAPRWSRRPLG